MLQAEIIQKYLGIPYQHHGRGLSGLDCYGLILEIFKDQGVELWDIHNEYDQEWSWKGKDLFIENYAREWERVTDFCFMDVVCFKNGKNVVNHAGVYLRMGKFIHAVKAGVVVSRLTDRQWQERYVGCYRYKTHD
jgi:cell wall-associated NlpC family hydrolase